MWRWRVSYFGVNKPTPSTGIPLLYVHRYLFCFVIYAYFLFPFSLVRLGYLSFSSMDLGIFVFLFSLILYSWRYMVSFNLSGSWTECSLGRVGTRLLSRRDVYLFPLNLDFYGHGFSGCLQLHVSRLSL